MPKLDELEDGVAVSAQLQPDDFKALAELGYGSIISNRPDGERGVYPTAAEAEALANAHGLHYRHIPVSPEKLDVGLAEDFKAALAEVPRPIVAHCGTGRRSSIMWALSRASEMAVEDILERCREAGHDLMPLRPLLESKAGGV
jgi:sulfide:quinone oxidoreductase